MAGGMGWGIRGQFGHETGAMIAGVLVGFTLVLLFFRHLSSLQAARAVALFVLGISCGGAMTYGQTLGLTQNPAFIGNWNALGWGLLGVFIKGGIWIGLAGAFLGMGVGGQRYRAWEGVLLLLAMLGLFVLGVWLLNRPFDPAHRVLPRIYFSADWVWEPTAQLKPRPECWGGLLCALLGLITYLGGIRRDRFAAGLAFAGFLAGGIGFALGQTVQAAHAWNRHWFETGPLAQLEPHINWWNMMFVVPLVVTIAAAWWFAYRGRLGQRGMAYARGGLILSTALYWSLNVAFFRFPWPWQPWTARTPSALIFTVCAVSLIGTAIWSKNHPKKSAATASPEP